MLPLRYVNKETDTFTCDGGPCPEPLRYYQDLPENIQSRFPMRGTKNLVSSLKSNTLYLPQTFIAYYFLEATSNSTYSTGDWIDTGHYGEFLGKGVNAKIYKKILPAGLHRMESQQKALLFTKSGKIRFESCK